VPSGRLLGGIWEDGDFGGKLAVAGIDTDGDGCSLDQVEQRSGMPFHKCGTVWRLLRTIPSDKIKEISGECFQWNAATPTKQGLAKVE
jgi:hypothetical protein